VGVLPESFSQAVVSGNQLFARLYGATETQVAAYELTNGLGTTHWEVYAHPEAIFAIAYLPTAQIPEDPHYVLVIGGDGYLGLVDFHPAGDSASLLFSQPTDGAVLRAACNGTDVFTYEVENGSDYYLRRYTLDFGGFTRTAQVAVAQSTGPFFVGQSSGGGVFIGQSGFAGTSLMAYDATQPDTLIFAHAFDLFNGTADALQDELYFTQNESLLRYDISNLYSPVRLDSAYTGHFAPAICIPQAGVVASGEYVAARAFWLHGSGSCSTSAFAGDNYFLSICAGPTGHVYYSNSSRTTVLLPNQTSGRPSRTPTGNLALWPNPAQGAFTVALPNAEGGTAQLLNALGQMVWQTPLPAQRQATLSPQGLPSGHYTLRVWQQGSPVQAHSLVLY
jgi:hypothetical protein